MPDLFHISSLIVHARPERADAVAAAISAMAEAEVHAQQAGRLIVTLETADEHQIVARLDAIALLDGVLSTSLVYHHAEPLTQPGDATWTT